MAPSLCGLYGTPTPWDPSLVWWYTQGRLRPRQPPVPSPISGLLDSVLTPGSEDEEYVPPKPEVREIKEEGSVFTMRGAFGVGPQTDLMETKKFSISLQSAYACSSVVWRSTHVFYRLQPLLYQMATCDEGRFVSVISAFDVGFVQLIPLSKCKLFYKKADQWTERGLGNLHIIPSDDQKFQLLVRADTNLGNILLNILVTKDIPMHLQKNNITFACVPLPPLPGDKEPDASSPTRPVPMLIRVKTEDMATELLKNLDKYRGKTE
ncbi:unnamed protein product [Schistocephalus solidus]|uniref:RanBD1 domain-containing protein n=1 Tax=Schistocephalus solidus TaxID=70667 RepID=A0A183TMN0_SCHSO|nr:unnamed protein product [Schistocephalus solidus]